MGIVRGICISAARGTKKTPVAQARLVENWGIEGDAHAGKWHRQVSLLSLERIREFQARGVSVEPGDFGENLIVEGYDLKRLHVGTRLRTRGGCLLEVTQIGKECHSHCQIFRTVGDCIMPREGIFARVIRGGLLQNGDTIVLEKGDGEYEADED